MSSPTTSDFPPHGPLVDLSTTYGPILIALLFSTGLLGITICQTWTYHNNFPKDKPILKITVYYVVFMEALRLAFAVHGIYYYLVAQWGNPIALTDLIWTSQIFLLMSSLTEVAVRLYFTYRVWIISQRNLYIITLLVTLCLAHLSVGVATWAVSFTTPVVAAFTPVLHHLGNAALALSVPTDWCISLSLIYFLNRNRSGMANTESIINRIVFYTINMGLITSCFDICVLVLGLISFSHVQLYNIALYQIVGNLYANSLLASLNSRIALRQSASANIALSDFSAFEAQAGNETESTAMGDMRTDRSKVYTLTGRLESSFPSTKLNSSKHDTEGGYKLNHF